MPVKRKPKQVQKYQESGYISTGCPKMDGNKKPECSLIHRGEGMKKTVTNILNNYII
jgi:hypothetical protein